jgi:DNA-binding response OmpR family regulator
MQGVLTRSDEAQSQGNVLIVDDDPPLARMLALTLRGSGFDVRCATDGASALEAVEQERPDAIVLDVHMPVMDGYAFFQELRSRGVDVPVLISSADDSREAQRRMGAEGYLDKPFHPDALVNNVRELIPR